MITHTVLTSAAEMEEEEEEDGMTAEQQGTRFPSLDDSRPDKHYSADENVNADRQSYAQRCETASVR